MDRRVYGATPSGRSVRSHARSVVSKDSRATARTVVHAGPGSGPAPITVFAVVQPEAAGFGDDRPTGATSAPHRRRLEGTGGSAADSPGVPPFMRTTEASGSERWCLGLGCP